MYAVYVCVYIDLQVLMLRLVDQTPLLLLCERWNRMIPPANLPTRHHYLNMGCFTIFVQCMRESVNHYSSVEWPNPSGSRKCSHFSCVTNRKSVDKCVHLLCYPMRVICVKFSSTGEDKDAVESTNIIPANIDSPTKHTILSQCSCFS